ncbi:MAG: hypothetical protein ACE5OZ_07970 [Candidatus Heimdallarchaeota archaeon]
MPPKVGKCQMTGAPEDASLEKQALKVEKRLVEGVTWVDLTSEERSAIVRVSREAGLSWRSIAERVGKQRTQHGTITSWVRDHLPALISSREHKAASLQSEQQDSRKKITEKRNAAASKARIEEPGLSTQEVLQRVEKQLEAVTAFAERVSVFLEKGSPGPIGLPSNTGRPPPPPPPASASHQSPPQQLLTASDQRWADFDWSLTTIQKLNRTEIEGIPAGILEELSVVVISQLNDRMAELQSLEAMTAEERAEYLHQQQVAKELQEVAESSTQAVEDHELYRRRKEYAEAYTTSSWGHRGQWNRQLDYWFCLTCKLKFPFEGEAEEQPKPESCPRCETRDIEPWSPGNDPVREEI